MSDAKEKDALTRRGFLGVGSAALAAASLLSADELAAQAQEQSTAKPATDRSASDPGPTNSVLDAANPDSNHPVPTDAGGVQTFKYPFSFAHKRQHEGGWSREVTQRELAISTTLAGVDMRLTAGGVRELHWHSAAEWAFMLYGSARITCIDFEGKSFVTDVKEGDLWFFPTGIPHSIQGLAPDGCEFLLVFDDGNFSEYATVLLSDFMAHTPPEVVAKNFGVNQQALVAMPNKELFIFQAEVPGALAEDRRIAAGALGPSPIDFAFRTMQTPPTKSNKSGEVRIIDSNNFKISQAISAAIVTVKPGGLRELHWHPNADEWQFYFGGKARMTVFATGGRARTMDFETGDVGYIQKTLPHYIENTGTTDLKFLEMFQSPYYQDLALTEWLVHTPPELVAAHLHLDKATLEALPREKPLIMPE
ncbi:MAG: cupin domain-containing protein [Candidatus Acidiferrales bacterium]